MEHQPSTTPTSLAVRAPSAADASLWHQRDAFIWDHEERLCRLPWWFYVQHIAEPISIMFVCWWILPHLPVPDPRLADVAPFLGAFASSLLAVFLLTICGPRTVLSPRTIEFSVRTASFSGQVLELGGAPVDYAFADFDSCRLVEAPVTG